MKKNRFYYFEVFFLVVKLCCVALENRTQLERPRGSQVFLDCGQSTLHLAIKPPLWSSHEFIFSAAAQPLDSWKKELRSATKDLWCWGLPTGSASGGLRVSELQLKGECL